MSSSVGHGRSRVPAPAVPLAVSATPHLGERTSRSNWEDEEHDSHRPLVSASLVRKHTQKSNLSLRSSSSNYGTTRPDTAASTASRPTSARQQRPIPAPDPIITISASGSNSTNPDSPGDDINDDADADYVTVDHLSAADAASAALHPVPKDKASRVLGIRHRKSMEPIPAPNRASIASVRSAPAPDPAPTPPSGPILPLASLYVVSGLPKSPHTWTLADPDSVMGLHHTDGAVGRWWRPEALGSTVSPGAGGHAGKKKRKSKADDNGTVFSSSGHLSKQEVGKMLSKALKLSFTREVEIIASTLQPASTVHNFTFTLPAPSTPLAPNSSTDMLRASVLSGTTDAETDMDGAETDADVDGGAVSESDFEVASTVGHGPGESTLFLPGDTVFWLPYALTLVSRYPIYDLMRDYLTLSWARFSKDVQSHTLQISKILSHPAPRPGELVRLDASSAPNAQHGNLGHGHGSETSLEVVSRFPGGLDFGRGLVDVNFTMWPLFKCLNIDNILTICEIALSPTGRILFFSRHPAMLGIAVLTVKYLVELRGWNGVALSAVHSRDAKIYIDDPGPWIMGLATEARYAVRAPSEVCIVDLDINYLNCASPPPGVVSSKQQRDKYRQKLLSAFEPLYHPDHCVPSEFKEAFPAGRFRPVCKIQAKRGAASTAVADMIKPPEWWHSTRIIQAFDSVLQDKFKKPSLLKRISSFGTVRAPPRLTPAEQHIQLSIRKRATAFVDARDDLETKIGRLSRRLNFLMTESDLWRDKFVTFEQYAEKLSVEASELRAKINKEQRETKRLSSMVSMTAAEKAKLQNQLRDTETAHKNALEELEKMRDTMMKMEEEREEMIAEVEAQIERALAHMAVDVDESSDYGSSRPSSRLSSRSAPSTLRRRPSDSINRPLRSFSTDSTLAEAYNGRDDGPGSAGIKTVPEVEEEEEPMTPSKKKRFSASKDDMPQDGMYAVDEGISQKSDKIAQKVLQIQRKLESALAVDAQRRSLDSESEFSEAARSATGRRRQGSRNVNVKHQKLRSITISPVGSGRNTPIRHGKRVSEDRKSIPAEEKKAEPVLAETKKQEIQPEKHKVDLPGLRKIPSLVSLNGTSPISPSDATANIPSLTTAASATTDDEDTDFQSAYSTSPRGSYGSFENFAVKSYDTSDSDVGTPTTTGGEDHLGDFSGRRSRDRASSTGTAKDTKSHLRVSQDTVMTATPRIATR
ncbi:unnamed protein product [Somion occarium]|uniref:cDENN domain-containing protein n=1 Tax=Somion occarium TaxID=3059160 RepID=A0ABP1CM95_9APHY